MRKKTKHLLFTGILFGSACLCGCVQTSDKNPVAPSQTPTITYALVPSPTEHATAAPQPSPGSALVPTATEAPLPAPTETPVPTPTETPVPTPTEAPLPTPTETPVPTELPSVFSKSEKIAVIHIETENGQEILSREDYVNCKVSIFNAPEEYCMDSVEAGIRVRGNSSAYYGNIEKLRTNEVPYRIKFNKKTNVLGLNDGAECKSWVLLRCDEGLMREKAAMDMGRAILGDEYFCSDAQFVHLYINNEFKWLTLLCEQSQVNKHRVNITEPEKDYTGTDIGYFLEIDNYADASEHPLFRMNYEKATISDYYGETQTFTPVYYSVKSDTYSKEQVNYIANYTRNVFTVLYQACVFDNYMTLDASNNLIPFEQCSSAKEAVDAVINLDSVVRMYILDEIVHDNDVGEGSFFMCVDFASDSNYPKLTFTCPWDFEWTYTGKAKGSYYAGVFNQDKDWIAKYGNRSNPWYILFLTQDWFLEMVKEQWEILQKDQTLENILLEERAYMKEYSTDLNRKKSNATATGNAILNWIENRIEWLDEVWLD